jgi:hypothetical protein
MMSCGSCILYLKKCGVIIVQFIMRFYIPTALTIFHRMVVAILPSACNALLRDATRLSAAVEGYKQILSRSSLGWLVLAEVRVYAANPLQSPRNEI